MKLFEITNIASPGNETTLSGGKLPNVYKDNANSVSKLPRTKQKDMYGGNGMKTGIDTGASDGGAPTGAAPSGGAAAGGAAAGGAGGGSGGGGGAGGGGA